MRTIEKIAYKFSELSDEAKENAIEKFSENHLDYEWWDFVYEDAITIGKLIGIDIDKIYFSGFSSQGDGAMFEGSYSYERNGVNKLKEYATIDLELHQIAKRLQSIQKNHFYKLSADVKHRGHYYHSGCSEIRVWKDGNYLNSDSELSAEEDIIDCMRDFMEWIYRHLEKEYEYLMSAESITETIEANEYEFDENGTMI